MKEKRLSVDELVIHYCLFFTVSVAGTSGGASG